MLTHWYSFFFCVFHCHNFTTTCRLIGEFSPFCYRKSGNLLTSYSANIVFTRQTIKKCFFDPFFEHRLPEKRRFHLFWLSRFYWHDTPQRGGCLGRSLDTRAHWYRAIPAVPAGLYPTHLSLRFFCRKIVVFTENQHSLVKRTRFFAEFAE